MEKIEHVERVETVETRSGKSRYVLRDATGAEYTTFRPRIGEAAAACEGRRARIVYHEEERNGFQNVYLDAVEPVAEEAPAAHDEAADEVAWKAAIDAAPWLLGTDHPTEAVPPDELFGKLRPFKERVADDIDDAGE